MALIGNLLGRWSSRLVLTSNSWWVKRVTGHEFGTCFDILITDSVIFFCFWYGVFIRCSNPAGHLHVSSCLLPISLVILFFLFILPKYISVFHPPICDLEKQMLNPIQVAILFTCQINSGDGMLHWRLVNEMDAIDGLIQARWH